MSFKDTKLLTKWTITGEFGYIVEIGIDTGAHVSTLDVTLVHALYSGRQSPQKLNQCSLGEHNTRKIPVKRT